MYQGTMNFDIAFQFTK